MEHVESKNVYRFDKDYFQHWFLSINDTGFSVSNDDIDSLVNDDIDSVIK